MNSVTPACHFHFLFFIHISSIHFMRERRGGLLLCPWFYIVCASFFFMWSNHPVKASSLKERNIFLLRKEDFPHHCWMVLAHGGGVGMLSLSAKTMPSWITLTDSICVTRQLLM